MMLNQVIELSTTLDAGHFQKMLAMAYSKSEHLTEIEDGYLDLSMAPKGITVIFRDSQYKKKVRLLVSPCLVVDNPDDVDKLVRKLDKRISKYFNNQNHLDDFTVSGTNVIFDIDVGNRKNVAAYTKVLQRIGKVKGFSPASYDGIDDKTSFCLSGNSNDTDFLIYDLENMVLQQHHHLDAGQKELQLTSKQTKGILRVEVRLTKPKAVRAYTDSDIASDQIAELSKERQNIFFDTFARAIPYGDFYKKSDAIDFVRQNVKNLRLQRRMLRLIALISEKKSLLLAQKAMSYRKPDKLLIDFANIGISPVTICKRADVKYMPSLYSYIDLNTTH